MNYEMKRKLLFFIFTLLVNCFVFSQGKNHWTVTNSYDFELTPYAQKGMIPENAIQRNLNLSSLVLELKNAPDRFKTNESPVIVSFPNLNGGYDAYKMFEASNFEEELKVNFPEINSYVGYALNDKSSVLRISVDPRGVHGMIFRGNGDTEFFTPISKNGVVHAFYKSDRNKGADKNKKPFTCTTPDEELVFDNVNKSGNTTFASDGRLLTFRAAISCTGEYAQYHGGTVAGALAAINTTITRVNAVYERDLAIRMVVIGNNNLVVYTNPDTDPYTTNYNSQVQSTLTSVIGNANYDVGHLFVFAGDNGNAGCIGCVCVNPTGGTPLAKGSAFTAADPPEGEKFDIDYVAHEYGHQFGGRHTFSHARETSSVAQREVGGGTTIMGYAGITGQNAQMASDDYFHAGSIDQIQVNMVGKTCPTSTPITHSAPIVNAGTNYTIPISTPFVLTGSATDAGGGALTYCWEQYDTMLDSQTGAASAASPTKESGPNFRSFRPTTSPTRYFPTMSAILNNSTTSAGSDIIVEALSSVARTLNFRLTVRDNVLNGGQTNFGNMTVTVDGTRGPLTVTSQNTAGISYNVNSTQTITWAVNNTNAISGGANVDILITTDNGQTWTTLLANTPNDGSQAVTMPSTPAPYCRIMVKASNNIFFNVNTQNFSVGYTITTTCNSYTFNTAFAIPDNDTNFTVRSINVPTTANISDVNLAVNITHTWIGDVQVILQGPMATTTQSTIFNRSCSNNDNINAVFDDQGAAIVCAPTITGNVSPSTPLSVFNGLNPNGSWLIGVRDLAAQDTGNVVSYTLTVCSEVVTLNSESFGIDDFTLYPNPNNGNFNIQFTSNTGNEIKVNVHDIRGREIFTKSYNNNGLFNETLQLNGVQSGVYLVTVQDGARKEVKKIVVQ